MGKIDGKIYQIGIATTDVTPPVGIPLSGFAARGIHSSTGIYHPLRAVAVVLDDGQTPVLVISIEWLGFYDKAKFVRTRLNQATGIPESQIVLTGTHTHCGPAVRQQDIRFCGWTDHEYLHRAMDQIATIADKAWKYRRPAKLQYGTGRCALAMNRRRPDPASPGKVLWGPHPGGPADHDVPVMTIASADNHIRGVLFSYACHPTSRDGLQIGGDYVGFAYDYIQEACMNAQPCFLQGCGGDQKPRPVDPNSDGFGIRTVEQVRAIGYELGEAVSQVIKQDKLQPITGPIAVRRAVIELETEPLDEKAVAYELSNPDAPAFRRAWAEHYRERIAKGLLEQRKTPFEIQVIQLGRSLVMVTLAAEMTVEHGLRLKNDLRERYHHVLPLAYANDIVGYVAVRRQFPELGYEVVDANQYLMRTGRFTADTEDRIHSTVRELLDDIG